jgi:hypothetical protein
MSPHTRETRAFANEIKFVVDEQVGSRIRDWARANLEPDPHGAGPFGDEYRTTSLYFDTADYDVFHRRGSQGRAKYRVRRYGDLEVVFLERKLRKPGLLVKRRTLGPIDVLSRLNDPHSVQDWPGEWFHRRLLVRRLRPVCQVSYHRTARGVLNGEGSARLTLDDDLRAASTESPVFREEAGAAIFGGRMILELKYRHHLPAIFKHLVETFALEAQPASKYRLSITALGHVQPGNDAPVLLGSDASHA